MGGRKEKKKRKGDFLEEMTRNVRVALSRKIAEKQLGVPFVI